MQNQNKDPMGNSPQKPRTARRYPEKSLSETDQPASSGQKPQNRTTPQGYRAAAPYTVEPRQEKERVPYSTREAALQKRKKARRKKRILRIVLLILVVLIAAALIFFAGWGIGKLIGGGEKDPAGKTDVTDTAEPAGSENANGTESAQPTEKITETEEITEPIPDYEAVKKVEGTPLKPYTTKNTINLADDPNIVSPYAVFMDALTGEIIAEKFVTPKAEGETGSEPDPAVLPDVIHTRIYPASLTKLMTILVAYENCEDLDATTFRMTNDIIDPLYTEGLALAGFLGGETITMRDMLYGAALPSGAEACVGLAIATSGKESKFVELMNTRAKTLGMKGTHFSNCSGHHADDHYSTLSDIAILLAYIEQNEELAEILYTYQYTSSSTSQHPEGVLLTSTVFARLNGDEPIVCEIIGGKTGYTLEAMQCLALYGVRNENKHPYVSVVAGGETKWKPVYDSIYLYKQFTGEPPEEPAETEEK